MKETNLWKYFWDKKVIAVKPLDRHFLWVKTSDFEAVKDSFRKEYNLFHPANSYRTKSFFKHIHAINERELTCIHHDFGNWTKFPPLILVHFFADVLFYVVYCLWKGIKIKDLSKPDVWKQS